MDHWILEIMSSYGYLGLALLIMAENLFPPIPSEIILTFGGFMTTYTRMHIPGTVLSATVGSVGGALILYQAGRFLSPDRLDTLLSGRLGRILHLKKADIQKAADWFDSRGNYTVFFCRFIPIVRSLISIPAGMADMALGRFLWMTVAGSFLWRRRILLAESRRILRQLHPGGENCAGGGSSGGRGSVGSEVHRGKKAKE